MDNGCNVAEDEWNAMDVQAALAPGTYRTTEAYTHLVAPTTLTNVLKRQ